LFEFCGYPTKKLLTMTRGKKDNFAVMKKVLIATHVAGIKPSTNKSVAGVKPQPVVTIKPPAGA
jgi:hypothetical protein